MSGYGTQQMPTLRMSAHRGRPSAFPRIAPPGMMAEFSDEPPYHRRTICLRRPSMLSARTSKIAIKVMPTGSRVAAARTARRLNCRSRSSLVLNMADRRASWAAAYRAAPHFADPAKPPAGELFTQKGRRAGPGNKKNLLYR